MLSYCMCYLSSLYCTLCTATVCSSDNKIFFLLNEIKWQLTRIVRNFANHGEFEYFHETTCLVAKWFNKQLLTLHAAHRNCEQQTEENDYRHLFLCNLPSPLSSVTSIYLFCNPSYNSKEIKMKSCTAAGVLQSIFRL